MEIWQIFMAIVPSILSGILIYKYEEKEKADREEKKRRAIEEKALKDGVESLLRDRLAQGIEYFLERGTVPLTTAKTYESMYRAYHNLGGNDIISGMYRRFVNLPHDGEGLHGKESNRPF